MSEKTVSQKLFIKANMRVAILNAPTGYRETLGALPAGVTVLEKATPPLDVIQTFVANRKELETALTNLKPLLQPKTILWITYIKGTSKMKTDINRDSIWAYCRTIGMDGVGLVSVDENWSAFRAKLV